jgi:predicted nucleotidyltransferase
MRFSAVLFDLDGTLVDSLADLHGAVNHALARAGRPPIAVERVRAAIGDGVRVLLARALLGWEEEPIEPAPEGESLGERLARLGRREARRRAAITELLDRAAALRKPNLEEAKRRGGPRRGGASNENADHGRGGTDGRGLVRPAGPGAGALARYSGGRYHAPCMNESIAARFESGIEEIRAVLASHGVVLGYLFGSVARRLERADSDLDVAVLLDEEIPRARYGRIRVSLTTELVGLTHTNDVDVVILNQAPPLLAFRVLSTGRLFMGAPAERVRFEVGAIKAYIDTRPLRARVEAAFERKLDRARAGEPKGAGPW